MTSPEERLGYPVTERTRFRVRVEIFEDLSGVPRVDWIRGCRSLEEAQRGYVAMREASGYGASQFGFGHVFDEAGQLIAHISYNGRLWAPEGRAGLSPWRPGVPPVAEAPEMNPEDIEAALVRLREHVEASDPSVTDEGPSP